MFINLMMIFSELGLNKLDQLINDAFIKLFSLKEGGLFALSLFSFIII
jgi:hypothetical protein